MIAFFNSIAGRMFLVLLVGTIGAAAVAFHLAAYQVQNQMNHERVVRTAAIIRRVAVDLNDAQPYARSRILLSERAAGIHPVTVSRTEPRGRSDAQLLSFLHSDFQNSNIRVVGNVVTGCKSSLVSCRIVSLVLEDGTRTTFAVDSPLTELHGRLVDTAPVFTALFVACLLALAYGVSRFSTRPLRDLARAARRLEVDIDTVALPETGPSEVREAATAFNAMQQRIQRDVRERTYMLAAITHDLQTPLTRLRLRMEHVEDETLRSKLVDDLAFMRDTAREGLELARSLETHGSPERIDLDALLDSVCADAQDAGHDVVLSGSTGAAILGSSNALRRCIANLLDNATKYGTYAQVESSLSGSHAIVRIRDGGPGIPDGQLQSVFDPFYRLEASRSRDTGGTGIGLTIARNIAERHRGIVTLRNHPEGGLEACLELPAER